MLDAQLFNDEELPLSPIEKAATDRAVRSALGHALSRATPWTDDHRLYVGALKSILAKLRHPPHTDAS